MSTGVSCWSREFLDYACGSVLLRGRLPERMPTRINGASDGSSGGSPVRHYFATGLIGTGLLTSIPQTCLLLLTTGWIASPKPAKARVSVSVPLQSEPTTRMAVRTLSLSRTVIENTSRNRIPWVLVAGGFHSQGGMDKANAALAACLLDERLHCTW